MKIVVVGPHPDDQELGMGGTIAALSSVGHEVVLADMTDGEPTPFGDSETRAKEARESARILGVRRSCLGLRNRFVEHDIESRHLTAGLLRLERPEIVFLPYFEDAHPDHRASTRIVEDARFDAKLSKIDLPGDPWHVPRLVYYYCTHLKVVPQPSFIFDTSGFHDRKMKSILAYASQFVTNQGNRGIVDWVDSAATYFGSRIGAERGEPFFVREPLGLRGLSELI